MKKRWIPVLLAIALLAAALLNAQFGCLAELSQMDYAPPVESPTPEPDYSGREPAYMIDGVSQSVKPLELFPDAMPGSLILPDGTSLEVAGALTEGDDSGVYEDYMPDDLYDGGYVDPQSPKPGVQTPTALASDSGARRTVMLYMIGSDLESNAGLASEDLTEIINSRPDLDQINVVIATGGAFAWESVGLQDGQMQVMKLNGRGECELLDSAVVRNMADPATLSYFLRLAMSACPAERYDLILWNHGGGPLVGYGYDECAQNIMSLWSIATALSDSGLGPMRRLEILGFDACLMGSVEVAAMMAPYAEYLVASEEAEVGAGWDYGFLGNGAMCGANPEAIVRDLCTRFESGMRMLADVDYTLSAVRLDDVAAVGDAMDSLFFRDAEFQPQDVGAVATCVDASCAFSRFNSTQHYDLFDLKDFAERARSILPGTAPALSRAVDGCMVCNVSNMPGANGLSFYFPMDEPRYAYEYLDRVSSHLADMGFAQGYATFLRNALSGGGLGGSGIAPTLQGQAVAGVPVYSMQLTPEQHARFARGAYLVLARLDEPGEAYRVVESSRNVFLDSDGTFWTAHEKAFFCLGGWQDGSWCEGPLLSCDIRNGVERFQIIMTLMRMPSGLENLKYWRTGNMCLQIEVDRRAETGRVYHMIPKTDTGLPSREVLDIQYDDIISASYIARRPRYDASGSVLPYTEWERYYPNGFIGWEHRVGASGLVIDYRPGDPNTEYFIQLIAYDVNGNATASPLMPMR